MKKQLTINYDLLPTGAGIATATGTDQYTLQELETALHVIEFHLHMQKGKESKAVFNVQPPIITDPETGEISQVITNPDGTTSLDYRFGSPSKGEGHPDRNDLPSDYFK